MSTVVGLDLSLTRTGIAIWRDGQMRTASTPPLSADGKSYDARNRRIVSQVYSILNWVRDNAGKDFDLAVVEGPILHGPQTGSFFDRAQLWGFVFSQLRSREWRIPVAVVNNATLKQWATGKGNADKPMMLAAAREVWPRVSNHDEADSAWLACIGAVKLGDYPPVALTDWRLNGMQKVEWPVMAT